MVKLVSQKGGRNLESVFWREKGTKRWYEGWIAKREGNKVMIANYNGAPYGHWYSLFDIEIEKRR